MSSFVERNLQSWWAMILKGVAITLRRNGYNSFQCTWHVTSCDNHVQSAVCPDTIVCQWEEYQPISQRIMGNVYLINTCIKWIFLLRSLALWNTKSECIWLTIPKAFNFNTCYMSCMVTNRGPNMAQARFYISNLGPLKHVKPYQTWSNHIQHLKTI